MAEGQTPANVNPEIRNVSEEANSENGWKVVAGAKKSRGRIGGRSVPPRVSEKSEEQKKSPAGRKCDGSKKPDLRSTRAVSVEANERRKPTVESKHKGPKLSTPYGPGGQEKFTGRRKAKEVNSQTTLVRNRISKDDAVIVTVAQNSTTYASVMKKVMENVNLLTSEYL